MRELVRDWPWRKIAIGTAVLALLMLLVGVALFYAAGFRSLSEIRWFEFAKRQLFAIPLLVGYTIQFALFLLPGACVVVHVSKSRTIPPCHLLPAAITASAACGYAAFWVYFFAPLAGKVFSFALMGACAVYLFRHRQSHARALFTQRDVALPGAFYFCAGFFYLGYLWLFDRGFTPDIDAQTRMVHHLPPDNVLPAIFAEKLVNGIDPSPLSGDWLSSDRPPLQAGLAMLQRPFRIVRWNYNYQLLGTIYQTIWIPILWCLCRSTGFSERRTAWTLIVSLISGFFLLNSIYVWPKLLAASLVLWAFALLWEPLQSGRKPTVNAAALAGLSASLGFLSHGGVAFTLIALGLFFLLPKFFIGWKQIAAGCALFIAAYIPWSLYQKYYDPPANRLLKLYLAGVDETTSRGTWQAIKDTHGPLSASQIWDIRKSNIGLVGADFSNLTIQYWQTNEFFRILPGIGAINIGWLALLFAALRARHRPLEPAERAPFIFLAIGVLSLLVWWALLGGREQAVIHQGSYATMMLLIVGLSAGTMIYLPRALQVVGLLLHLTDFIVVWVLSTPQGMTWNQSARQLNLIMAFTVCVAVAALIYILRRTRSHEEECETKSK